MNKTPNKVGSNDLFLKRALALTEQMRRAAEEITTELGLPSDSVFDVLAGITPLFLEELKRDQGNDQSPLKLEKDVTE